MASKLIALISIIGLAGTCAINASPSPSEHRTPKKAATAPSPTPAASATPTNSSRHQTLQISRAILWALANRGWKAGSYNATPVPGGGHGRVWVDADTHVYHKEGSRFYGKTKKGKYITEDEAIKDGYYGPAKKDE